MESSQENISGELFQDENIIADDRMGQFWECSDIVVYYVEIDNDKI